MRALFTILMITGSITHIWTAIIALTVSGFWACVITLIFPILSELFWMFKMFGTNNTYSIIVLIQFVLLLLISFFSER